MVREDLSSTPSESIQHLDNELLEVAKTQYLQCKHQDEDEEMRDARSAEEALFMLIN